MSQSEKAAYFRALKSAGVQFERHYREFTTDELKAAYTRLVEEGVIDAGTRTDEEPAVPTPPVVPHIDEPDTTPPPRQAEFPPADAPQAHFDAAAFADAFSSFGQDEPAPELLDVPVRAANPAEMAGERQNTNADFEVIRVDPESGRQWIQEEVLKPAYPKPRGRRVLKYMDPGVVKQRVKAGDYIEEFEVPGDPANARMAEVRITLPSYQVGIFIDPRFPMFKVVTYNGNDGFDLFDVQNYYGGAELVPAECKRKYVENVLCYDIRTVVRAIETEYRHLVLAGKVQ